MFGTPPTVALAAALAVSAPVSLAGQTIRGMVVEAGTETPIGFARLALIRADGTVAASTTADGEGRFRLTASAGLYRLSSERLGYASVADSISLDGVGEVVVVVRMAVEAVPLDPIVVVGRSALERGRDGFERRRALGRGLFLTIDSIRARQPVLATDAFYSLPGVIVHEEMPQGRDGRRDPIIHTTSGAKCLFIYMDYIVNAFAFGTESDALRTARNGERFPPGTPPWIFRRPVLVAEGVGLNQFVDAESLRGIEVYRNYSEVPEELRQGLRMHDFAYSGVTEPCGIAWVWTKNAW